METSKAGIQMYNPSALTDVYLPLGQEEVLAALRQANPIDYQPENYEDNTWPRTITGLLTDWRSREDVHFEWCQNFVDADFQQFEVELQRLCSEAQISCEKLPIGLFNNGHQRAAIQLFLAQQKRVRNVGKEGKIEILRFVLHNLPMNPKIKFGGNKTWVGCTFWRPVRNVKGAKTDKKVYFYCVRSGGKHGGFELLLDEQKQTLSERKIEKTNPTYEDISSYLIPLIYNFPYIQLPPVEEKFYDEWDSWTYILEKKRSEMADFKCIHCSNNVGDFRLLHHICRHKTVSCFDCYYHKLVFLGKLRDKIYGPVERSKRPTRKNHETDYGAMRPTTSQGFPYQPFSGPYIASTFPTSSASNSYGLVGYQEVGKQPMVEVIELDDSDVSGGRAKFNQVKEYCMKTEEDLMESTCTFSSKLHIKLRSEKMLIDTTKAPTTLDANKLELQKKNLEKKKILLEKETDEDYKKKKDDARTHFDTVWCSFEQEVDQKFYDESLQEVKKLLTTIDKYREMEQAAIKEEIDNLEEKLEFRTNSKLLINKTHFTVQDKNEIFDTATVHTGDAHTLSSKAFNPNQNAPDESFETPNRHFDTPGSFGRSQELFHEVLSLETHMQQDPRQPGPSSEHQRRERFRIPYQNDLNTVNFQRQHSQTGFRTEASIFESGPLNYNDVPRHVPRSFVQMDREAPRQIIRGDQGQQHMTSVNPPVLNRLDNGLHHQQRSDQHPQPAPAEPPVPNPGQLFMQNGEQIRESIRIPPAQNFRFEGQDRSSNPNPAAVNQGYRPIYNFQGLVNPGAVPTQEVFPQQVAVAEHPPAINQGAINEYQGWRNSPNNVLNQDVHGAREANFGILPRSQVVAELPAAVNRGNPILYPGYQRGPHQLMHQQPARNADGQPMHNQNAGFDDRNDHPVRHRSQQMIEGRRSRLMQRNQQLPAYHFNHYPYVGNQIHQTHPYMRPHQMAQFPQRQLPPPVNYQNDFPMNPPPPPEYNGYNEDFQ